MTSKQDLTPNIPEVVEDGVSLDEITQMPTTETRATTEPISHVRIFRCRRAAACRSARFDACDG